MRIALLAAMALALLVGVAGAAPQLVGSDFRISNVGPDGNADRAASSAAIAYNSVANEYLVVWEGDGLSTGAGGQFEIFGQRLDANGTEIGPDLPISNVTAVAPDRDASDPALAYNPATNQYLVIWEGDGLATNNELEIFGQLLSTDGTEIGGDFPISSMGVDGDQERGAFNPAVTFNAATNQYLVAWGGDGLATDDEFEIFGQLLSTEGTEIGGDFPISSMGADGDPEREAFNPALTYSPATNQYLAVWEGDGLAINNDLEIFGQRLNADGTESGEDFPISNATVAANRDALGPALTYNSATNEYLVVWEADGLATNNEFEIFGQRLGGAGGEVGGDFRISNTGADGDQERRAFQPAITYNPTANAYLVAWEGDGLATDNELEIFAQPLGADGAEIGAELRVSNVGADGDPLRQAFSPALASNPTANEYLVAWEGNGLATDEEFEIFGRRLAEPIIPNPQPAGKCAGVTATKTGTPGADLIKGTPKRDVIAALGGRDTIRSLGGKDLVCGGAGNDRIFGGKGKDKLRGDAGADQLNGDSGNDDLRGGKGRDVLKGGKGRDVLKGGPGKDVLAGGPGKDREA